MRLLIALFSFTLVAFTQEARHIDFTQPLVGLDGKALKNGEVKDSPTITLGDMAVLALEQSIDDDKNASGLEKFKRDQLARKVYQQNAVELSVEEITLIKDRIGKVCTPTIIGATWPLLDPSLKEKTEKTPAKQAP